MVTFEDLPYCDLHVGAIHEAGKQGTFADDPLARIVPVGNQGGFRYKGSPVKGTVRLVAMYTTGAEAEWPDHLQTSTGVLTYFGDNRQPGQKLLDTRRKGNVLLQKVFTAAYGSANDRSGVAPFLLFEKADRGRDMTFRGLAAPGRKDSSFDADLQSVWKDLRGARFENYVAKFTVLACASVPRTWIDAVTAGAAPLDAPDCPHPWREWVAHRTYNALIR